VSRIESRFLSSRKEGVPSKAKGESGLARFLNQAASKVRRSDESKSPAPGGSEKGRATTASSADLEKRLAARQPAAAPSAAVPGRNMTWSFAAANQTPSKDTAKETQESSVQPQETPAHLKGEVPEDWKPVYGQDGVTVYQDGQGQSYSQKVVTQDGVRTVETTTPDGAVHTVSSQDGVETHETRTEGEAGEEKIVSQVTRPDGSIQITTSDITQSEQGVEDLAEVPSNPGDPTKTTLPQDGRGPSTVKEVEVIEYAPNSQQGEVVGRTREVSQSSSAVTGDLGEGVTHSDSDSQMTVTVTEMEVLNPETNKFEKSTGASAQVTLAGTRADGSQVSALESNTWNSQGQLQTTQELRGFRESEVQKEEFQVKLGGKSTDLRPDTISDKAPLSHLKDKGDTYDLPFQERHGDADQFLGTSEDSDMPVDVRVSVDRSSNGEETETTEIGNLDPTKDGKTVTRMQSPSGEVSWNYRNIVNNGKDIYSQTVAEGTNLSQYSEYHDTGNGTFRLHEATYQGSKNIDYRDTVRTNVSNADIDADPSLSPEEKERLKSEPGPHYRDSVHQNFQSLVDDDDKLLRDDAGNIVREGFDFQSTSYSANGYVVSQANLNQASQGASSFHQVNDPTSPTPIAVTATGNDGKKVETQVDVSQTPPVLTIDGEVVGEFQGNLGQPSGDSTTFLVNPGFVADLAQSPPPTSTTVFDLNKNLPPSLQGPENQLKVTQESKLAKLSKAGGVLGMAWGSHNLVNGLASGDIRQSLAGASSLGTSSTAFGAALSGLSSHSGAVGRLGQAGEVLAGPLGKALGVAGGAIQLGMGLERFATEDGKGQAAGFLTAAAGGAAVATVFFPPAALAALAFTALAWGVDKSAESDTAPVDSRVWLGDSAG